MIESQFDSVTSGEKEQLMLASSDHFLAKDRLSLHAFKYVYSKVTYFLKCVNCTSSQCSKWGKGETHVTIIRSLHSSRIDYHYMHSNMSIKRQLPENQSVAPVHSVASEEKELIMLPLSDHFTRQG